MKFIIGVIIYLMAANLFMLAWWKLMPSFYHAERNKRYVLGWKDKSYLPYDVGAGTYDIDDALTISLLVWWFVTGIVVVRSVGAFIVDIVWMVSGYVPYKIITRSSIPSFPLCSMLRKQLSVMRQNADDLDNIYGTVVLDDVVSSKPMLPPLTNKRA